MIKLIRKFFKCSVDAGRNDEFVWELAEALLWRDEGVSGTAIPLPVKQQSQANQYYDDAKYLIQFVTDRWDEKGASDE